MAGGSSGGKKLLGEVADGVATLPQPEAKVAPGLPGLKGWGRGPNVEPGLAQREVATRPGDGDIPRSRWSRAHGRRAGRRHRLQTAPGQTVPIRSARLRLGAGTERML